MGQVERRADDPWRIKLEAKVTDMGTKVDDIAGKVEEVHGTLTALEGAFKVFKWVATAIKYIGFIAGGVVAVVAAWKLGDSSIPVPNRIDIPK